MNIRRITLIWPYLERLATTPEDNQCLMGMIAYPLGLGYIAAFLRNDYDVDMLDLCARSPHPKMMPGRRVRFGCTDDEIRALIKERKPDVVGISQMFSYLSKPVANIVSLVNEVSPETIVVLGGIHPTVCPEHALADNSGVDFLVLGEGELPFRNLLTCLRANGDPTQLKALAYREGIRPVVSEDREPLVDLDSLPFPARDLLDMKAYKGPMNLISSRGCPFRCTFCVAERLHRGRWRARRSDRVVSELRHLVQRYGANSFVFQDDNIGVDQDRLATLFDSITESHLGIKWTCQTEFTVSRLTKDLLAKAKRSGITEIGLALESGNDRTLAAVNKPSRVAHSLRVKQWADELGLSTMGFLVIGLPGESPIDVQNSQKFAVELGLEYYMVMTLLPLPGSRVYDELTASGVNVDLDLISNFRYAHYTVSRMTPAEINTLREETDYLLNFKQCALLHSTRYDAAVAHFSNLSRKYPRVAKMHYYLGLAFYKAAKTSNAMGSFEKALRLDPAFEHAQDWCFALKELPGGTAFLDTDTEKRLGFLYHPRKRESERCETHLLKKICETGGDVQNGTCC